MRERERKGKGVEGEKEIKRMEGEKGKSVEGERQKGERRQRESVTKFQYIH